HRNIASLGEFEQALEFCIPGDREGTTSKRDQRARTSRASWWVWWLPRCVNHAGCAGGGRPEQFGMYMFSSDAPVCEFLCEILHERGWAAQIEVRVTRHADPLEYRYIEVADHVKVQPRLIFLRRA